MKVQEPKTAKTWNFKISKFEFFWYVLTGLVALWGVVYVIIGLIARNLPITYPSEGLVKANEEFLTTFKLDFFTWGLIIFGSGIVCGIICLLACAGKVDRDYEKKVRRAARLAQLEEEELKEEAKEEIVDAEVVNKEETAE